MRRFTPPELLVSFGGVGQSCNDSELASQRLHSSLFDLPHSSPVLPGSFDGVAPCDWTTTGSRIMPVYPRLSLPWCSCLYIPGSTTPGVWKQKRTSLCPVAAIHEAGTRIPCRRSSRWRTTRDPTKQWRWQATTKALAPRLPWSLPL